MELFKIFLVEEVSSIGLCKYRKKSNKYKQDFIAQNFNVNKQYFKPDYSNNFFLL